MSLYLNKQILFLFFHKACPKIAALGNVIKAIYFLRLKRTVIERVARSYFSPGRFPAE
jgi:hypothetical protein